MTTTQPTFEDFLTWLEDSRGRGQVHFDGRCCVAEGRAGSTPGRPGSGCECEFGEDHLEPAAGLGVVSEFVVAAA